MPLDEYSADTISILKNSPTIAASLGSTMPALSGVSTVPYVSCIGCALRNLV
jgi:hypothetical protein